MTGKDDGSIAVQVDDLATVSVEVDPAIVEAENKQVAVSGAVEPEKKDKEPKAKTKRVSPEPDVQIQTGPTAQEAIETAVASAKAELDARIRAAEATAVAERARADAAERGRLDAVKAAEELEQRASNSELTLVDSSIASAQRELEAQQEAYTRAAEAGEFAKMAQIQVKMSKAAAALDRFEAEKATIESGARRAPTTEGAVTQPQAPSKADQFLSQLSLPSQNWMRMHLDCLPAAAGGDPVKNSKMMAGHYAALSQNIIPDTPDYFRVIEEHLGGTQMSKATETQPAHQPAQQPVRPAAPVVPAAPVSRDAPQAGGQPQRSTREVRLTKEQQETAKLSWPHLPEAQAYGLYARNLLELEAEGKIGRTTH